MRAGRDALLQDFVEHGVMPINFACPNAISIGPDGVRSGISDVASPWSTALAETR